MVRETAATPATKLAWLAIYDHLSINHYADPQLVNEAIQAQSAQVDIVTGATDTSFAFMQSLADALAKAQA